MINLWGIYFGTYFQEIMAERRKSVFKHPSRHRRNRSSTPALDLLSPYLPGPELFISPPISAIQTRSAYSSASFDSSVNSASPLSIRYAPYSGTNSTLSFDSNPIPLNSSSLHAESRVVQDLPVRPTSQSAPPLQTDWHGPSRPSTSYMVSTQSNPMTSTSSNSQSGVQRFLQEPRPPNHTPDSFPGRPPNIVSSTTLSSGDVQVEPHHAITRSMVLYLYIVNFRPFYIRLFYIGSQNFICDLFYTF